MIRSGEHQLSIECPLEDGHGLPDLHRLAAQCFSLLLPGTEPEEMSVHVEYRSRHERPDLRPVR